MGQWIKRLAIGSLGISLLLGIGVGGLKISAYQAERQLDQKAEAFLKRYPKTESNAIAQRLDQYLIELKLDPVVSEHFQYSELAIESQFSDYFDRQLRKADTAINPVTSEIQSYLHTNQSKLREIQDLLLGNELPVWVFEVENAINLERPYLNISGLFRLHRLLLLQAIAANQNNNLDQREKALIAAWKVQEALAQHPLQRTFTPNLVRTQLGVMRHMDGLSTQWQARIKTIATPSQIIENRQLLNWLVYRSISTSKDLTKTKEIIGRQLAADLRFIPSSLFRLQNVNTTQLQDDAYQAVQSLMLQQNVCTAPLTELEPSIPWWNSFGKVYSIFPVSSFWSSAGAMNLTVEFTQKILQLKEVANQQRQWPKTLANSKSQVCEGVNWQYGVQNDTMTLTLQNAEPLTESRTSVVQYTELPYTYSDRL